MDVAADIAGTILAGFDKHYRLFREVSAQARERFEHAEWTAAWEANRVRIEMYDRRVLEAVERVLADHPEARASGEALGGDSLWASIKHAYIALLYDHRQPECAETFYNSVACRVLDRTYYHNEYIFWRPAVSTEHLVGEHQPTYHCYYPGARGLRGAIEEILDSFALRSPWEDRRRDVRRVLSAIRERVAAPREVHANFQIQVLSSLFLRNKAAYAVGRVINGNAEQPFALSLRKTPAGSVYVDALLLSREHIAALFSLARAYFMVDMEVPSAYVSFLRTLMPSKSKAELYTAVGLQKQGKTLFYRDLHEHLKHSRDQFVIAPGTKGMVMLVFTLPSFPYVFKLIRDRFAPPKDTTAERVREKYLLVKYHDRVGRMADTLEYSDVALPVARFAPALLEEMERLVPSLLERDGERLVLRHLYIERRLTPLDVYLKEAPEERLRHGIREYGNALRELAQANIFAGDLLLKNFGVTRYGRVVFYDYDEICYLTECCFRRIPPAPTYEDELRAEPWFSVGVSDIFPEEFPTFVFHDGAERDIFFEYHRDLTDAAVWTEMQRKIRDGEQDDLFPYPHELRFCNRHRDRR